MLNRVLADLNDGTWIYQSRQYGAVIGILDDLLCQLEDADIQEVLDNPQQYGELGIAIQKAVELCCALLALRRDVEHA